MRLTTIHHLPRKQRGLTIIEMVAAMLVIAILIGIVGRQITQGRSTQNAMQVQNDITNLRAAAQDWKGIRPNYTGVACAHLVENEYYVMPAWNNVCTGVNPFSGNYTVAAATTATNLTITATNLGTAACERIRNSMEPNALTASCSSGTLTVTYQG